MSPPEQSEQLYTKFAAAYARGMALCGEAGLPGLPGLRRSFDEKGLLEKPLDDLTEAEARQIIEEGKEAGLRFYCFKSSHDEMPRVKRVLGFLKSIEMENLLDIGSGRGVFLWPCMNAFPQLSVTSLDLLPHRVAMLKAVRRGGAQNLNAELGDICGIPLPGKSYDVVAMLEVLEHIPDVSAAIRAAVRIAKKYIIITVPSKPDDNPGHVHLLTKDMLTGLFEKAGCSRLHFDGVAGHLVMIAVPGD